MCLRKMTILFGARLSLHSPSSLLLTNRLAWLRPPRVGIEACATELCATVLCATELCATVLCLGILTQHFCRVSLMPQRINADVIWHHTAVGTISIPNNQV